MSQSILSALPPDQPVDTFAAAAQQSRNMAEASVRTGWSEIVAFFEDLARDNAAALKALGGCRSPLDVLVIEQNWLLARCESCFDAGLRLVLGAVHEPETAAAEATEFRLPE